MCIRDRIDGVNDHDWQADLIAKKLKGMPGHVNLIPLNDVAESPLKDVYKRQALQSALENEVPVTDDCSAVERLGKVVYLIDGNEENLKITTPVDLVIAEAILAEREGR